MNRIIRHRPTFFTTLTFMAATAGLMFSLPARVSQAQQDRQLVQTGSPNANTAKRIALVIGNGAYTTAPTLKNPPNDAREMAATLKALGFDVTSGTNVNQRDMKRLIREFGTKLKGGGSGLFYYAGHGVQSKGRNYLIPIDANIQSEAEVEDSGVDAALVLNFMDDAQNGLNIVILDACRNNPFARSFRSANDGLAQVDAPTGTLIAYATAPGRVASDGAGQNGLYTAELLKQMRVPGLSVTDMFMRVRAEVMKQTGSKQVPWEASSLVGSFFFGGSGAPSTPAANNTGGTGVRDDAATFELTYWDSIKNSNDAADFRSYLEQYPNGKFVALARNRLRSLPATKSSTSANPTTTSKSLDKEVSERERLRTGVGRIIGGMLDSDVAVSPRETCFRSDQGAASKNWNSHYSWAQGQNVVKLKTAIQQKLDLVFQCSSVTDEQAFDDFAAISVIIARYVPNAACFNGDEGVVSTDPVGHRNWAREQGRAAALNNLKSKAAAAIDCMDGAKRFSYYADISVLAAGGTAK